MEDLQIIELYFMKNQQALSETQTKYGAYCNSIARNILRDVRDVEEAVNQTWLEAWESIPPEKPRILSAFLSRITRNISLNIVRNHSAKKRCADFAKSFDELEMIGTESVEDEICTKQLAQSINEFIGELPEIQRKVFVCRYWYFDSIEEIGRRFGFSKGKVKSMLYRIRRNLEKHLKQEEFL
ncbi:MAG: sigma-70 family RNA polymerase sigma factor [Ruminococcus sp.]|nr:sigma-70 family RNA polymerase sigma factor [Ruminococcus sp.]